MIHITYQASEHSQSFALPFFILNPLHYRCFESTGGRLFCLLCTGFIRRVCAGGNRCDGAPPSRTIRAPARRTFGCLFHDVECGACLSRPIRQVCTSPQISVVFAQVANHSLRTSGKGLRARAKRSPASGKGMVTRDIRSGSTHQAPTSTPPRLEKQPPVASPSRPR